jgi:hypothetical protein
VYVYHYETQSNLLVIRGHAGLRWNLGEASAVAEMIRVPRRLAGTDQLVETTRGGQPRAPTPPPPTKRIPRTAQTPGAQLAKGQVPVLRRTRAPSTTPNNAGATTPPPRPTTSAPTTAAATSTSVGTTSTRPPYPPGMTAQVAAKRNALEGALTAHKDTEFSTPPPGGNLLVNPSPPRKDGQGTSTASAPAPQAASTPRLADLPLAMRGKERAIRLQTLADKTAEKRAAQRQRAPDPSLPLATITVDSTDSLQDKADYLASELRRTFYEIQVREQAQPPLVHQPEQSAMDYDGWQDVGQSLNDLRLWDQELG